MLQHDLRADVCKFDHVTPLLVNLHWLHVPECIQYKLCVLVHRCLNGAAPQYLSELIQPLSDVDSRRRLCSASTAEVLVPATRRSTIGDRAFAVASPRACNNLPVDLCLSRTFTTFKTHLKSHLFNLSFPSVWLYHRLFLYRALEAACAAYASLNLSLLHYITCLTDIHIKHVSTILSPPFRLVASVSWCWSWEKEERAVEVVPDI